MNNQIVISHLTQKEVDSASTQIDKMAKHIAKNFEGFTAKQRKSNLKFPSGGHTVVPIIADLARRYGADLPGMPLDQMEAKLLFASRLAPLARQVAQFSMLLNDLVFATESDGWQMATATYKTLKRMGLALPHLKQELEPVVSFFARKKKVLIATGAGASAPAPVVVPPKAVLPPINVTTPVINVGVGSPANGSSGVVSTPNGSSLNGHGQA